MKLNNYLSLNLYSLIGYFDIMLFVYIFIASKLYEHNCNLLDNFIYLSLDDLGIIYSILHIFAIFLVIYFLVEFILNKFNIKTIIINFDNIFYKILFYIGCITTSFGIFALITFYILMLYSK